MVTDHCWHKTRLAGHGFVKDYDGEVCCFCGITWSQHEKTPRNGHGKHDPDPVTKAKPKGLCSERMSSDQNSHPMTGKTEDVER